jgi:hypothetical protein
LPCQDAAGARLLAAFSTPTAGVPVGPAHQDFASTSLRMLAADAEVAGGVRHCVWLRQHAVVADCERICGPAPAGSRVGRRAR